MTVSPASPVTTGVDGNGASPFTITQVSSAGSKVHLAETHQDGFTDGAVSCTNGASGSSGAADVTVKPGDNVVCTFHNSLNTAVFSVTKTYNDGTTTAVPVSVSCTPGTVVGGSTTASRVARTSP